MRSILHMKAITPTTKTSSIGLGILILQLCWGCSVGGHHLPDRAAERLFELHKQELDAIVLDILSDSRFEFAGRTSLNYSGCPFEENIGINGPECKDFTGERWRLFQERIVAAQIVGVARQERQVQFHLDAATLFNGDSIKGLMFSSQTPHGVKERLLDGYRLDAADRDQFGNYFVTKRLRTDWYIYLFVSK